MFDFTGGAVRAREEGQRPVGMFDFTGGAIQAPAAQATPVPIKTAPITPPLPMPTPRIAGGELVSGGPRRGDAFMSGFANAPLVKAVTSLFHPKDKITMPRADPDYMSMTPQGAGEWLPYIAGAITGEAPTIAAAYATGGAAGAGALAGLGSKVPKLANIAKAPLAKLGARGAGAGLVHGTGRAAVEGKPLPESLKNIGLETALFAIGDPAITKGAQVAGKAIGKGVQAYKGSLEAPALKGLDLTRPNPPRSGATLFDDVPPPLTKGTHGGPAGAPVTPKGYTLEENKAVAQAALDGQDVTKLKDIGPVKAQHFDLFRIVSEVFGGNLLKGKGTKAKELILDPLDASKGAMTNFERQYASELKQNVVSRGIRAGSKESALLQDFGEGVMSEANLKKLYPERYREMLTAERAAKQVARTPEEREAIRNFRRDYLEDIPFTVDDLKKLRPGDWQKFVEAEQWFRQQYDTLRDSVNKVYEEVYAHAPEVLTEKLVPYRKDYFRHFRETGDSFADVMAMMETPANINPALVGKSEIMRPRSRWLSFAQRRGDGEYTKDAVGGFADYLRSSAYHIHITPHIGRLKALGENLAGATGETKNLNNFIQILQRHEQALAGKTHIFDRQIQEYVGRGPFRLLNRVNNRVRANSILGNAGTLVAQATHIPMAIAQGKQHAAPATVDMMRSLLGEMKGAAKGIRSTFDDPVLKSNFMNERYKSSIYRQFEHGFFRKGVNKAGAVLEFCDRLASTFTWHTMYRKAVAQGLENPIKWADDWTRGITAGRGIGEVPYALQSQMSRLVIPFQIEVNNIILVHRDLAKHDKVGLGMLAAASWLFNRFSEETRGSKLMPDPIMAIGEAAKMMMDEENDINNRFKRAGYRLGGEVLTSIPGGQHIGAALVPDANVRREYFGAADPTRYGTGLLARQAFSDPVYKILLPFGGGQVKKTIGGATALIDEGVYNRDGTKLSYPVNPDAGNAMKALIFGKYATREGRKYFSESQRPLSEKQTAEYKQMVKAGMKPEKVYGDMQKQRQVDAVDKKIKEVMDSNMPVNDKVNKIRELNNQKMKLMMP